MKESVTIQYLCEDVDTNLVETIPIASISIDQWSQGHPDLCIRIETAINNETGANEHHQQ